MKTIYIKLPLILLVLAPFTGFAQLQGNGCPNANFSYLSFQNWQGWYGSTSNVVASTGFWPGRHTIINSNGIDPWSCGGLNTLPPGMNVCTRLGNQSTGAQAERMSYSLTVDSSNALFIYKYAVVLQDPGTTHQTWERPRFEVQVKNAAGVQIGGNCGVYSVYAAATVPGFNNCNQIRWKDWTVVGLNLLPWIGQTITLEFTTYDCTQGAHFGYAYIAADCQSLEIDVSYCPGETNVMLVAPPGFASYSWNTFPPVLNDTLMLNNPNIGDTLVVTMETFSNAGNCIVTLSAIIVPTVMDAGFEVTWPCESGVVFQDTSKVENGNIQSWLWNFGDNNISTSQNPVHTYANPGTYPVTLIIYSKPNLTGCTDTVTKLVTVHPKPKVGFTSAISCAGVPSNFTDTTIPLFNAVSYSWSFGITANPSTSNVQNPSTIYPAPGTYPAKLVVTNNFGCSDSVIKPMTVSNFPVMDFNFVSQCAGDPIVFSDQTQAGAGDNIVSWKWDLNDGNISTNPQATAHTYTAGGVYQVEMLVESAIGCKDSITKPVQIYHIPQVAFSAPPQCFGDNLQFTDLTTVGAPSAVANHQWSFGDGGFSTDDNPLHQYLTPGTYATWLIVTSNHGCVGAVMDSVHAYDYPVSDFTFQDICLHDVATFTNTSQNPVDGSITSFSWNFGDGSPLDTVNYNTTHSFAAPGTYTVTLVTYSEKLKCSNSISKQIVIHPMPVAGFAFNDTCYNKETYFVDQSAGDMAAWVWSYGDSQSGTGAQTTHIFPEPGQYQTELLVTTVHGCQDSITKNVTVWPLPVPEFSTMNVCEGDQTFLFDRSTISSPYSVASLNWSFGDLSTDESVRNPAHFYADTGNYVVTLTAQSNVGCVDSLKRTVRIHPNPVPRISLNQSEGCTPVCVQFTNGSSIGSGEGIEKYQWRFSDGGSSTDQHPSYCFSTPGWYDVRLDLTSNFGCSASLTFTDTVKVHDYPTANFSPEPGIVMASNSGIFFKNLTMGGYSYVWNFGDGDPADNAGAEHPTHSYITAGQYEVTLEAYTEYGCKDEITQRVTVMSEFGLYIPNAFTPDGDGLNDVFKAEGTGITEFEMNIYDRWGTLIFTSNNINIGWDGTLRGKGDKVTHAQNEVYVYIIRAMDHHTPVPYIREGHFTLYR